MAVNLKLNPAQPVSGVALATVAAGIAADGVDDLVLIQLAQNTNCAAVFTQNAFCAAPVTVSKDHLLVNQGRVRALLINSGNANAGTGQPGIDMAHRHCEAVANALGCQATEVLPFSTGVIGQLLPDESMLSGIKAASAQLGEHSAEKSGESTAESSGECLMGHWDAASRGIMTTDTQPKLTSRSCSIDRQSVMLTGMSKGAGMIQPNMATMLAYVFTDAVISSEHLQLALEQAVAVSFNAITVDSDTSTNDACVLCATGAGITLHPMHAGWDIFLHCLTTVCRDLAQAIVRDAEGASKFITVTVSGGRDSSECRSVAYAVANSPLVKTAMFASDANVGRLLMAIGKAEIDALNPAGVTVSLGDVCAFERGGIADGYSEEQGAAVMAQAEITVRINLGRGDAVAEIYTSDLSHEYVSINADYRS